MRPWRTPTAPPCWRPRRRRWPTQTFGQRNAPTPGGTAGPAGPTWVPSSAASSSATSCPERCAVGWAAASAAGGVRPLSAARGPQAGGAVAAAARSSPLTLSREHRGLTALQPRRQIVAHGVDRDALLCHLVALTDGHRLVLERVEVDRHTERCADLVLAAVAPADGTRGG